jgi:integrase
MPKWISAARGIRYREHETRKHGKRPDRYWCLQYKLKGRTLNEAVGWWSQGANQAECERLLVKLRENWRIGQGPQTLKEMRAEGEAARAAEKRRQEVAIHREMTLAEFWSAKYYPQASLRKAANSVRTERLFFEKWLQPLAHLPLQEIGREHLETLVMRPILEKGLSARSLEYALATISQIWNLAHEYGIVAGENPVRRIKKPRQDNKRVRYLTEAEAARLLAALKIRSPEVHDLALLSLLTGMRPKECLSLTWADVDLSEGRIFVKDTKNSKNRHLSLTSEVLAMLRSRHKGQPGQTLVFATANGEENRWGVSDTFTRTVADLKLNEGINDPRQKVVFYTLRHTFASWLVQKGVPLYNVSQLMGHSDLQMTKRYAHLAPENQKAAIMVLEGVIGKK